MMFTARFLTVQHTTLALLKSGIKSVIVRFLPLLGPRDDAVHDRVVATLGVDVNQLGFAGLASLGVRMRSACVG